MSISPAGWRTPTAAISARGLRARRLDPDVHASAIDFLENRLAGGPDTPSATGIGRTVARRFAMKLQQYSGPVMAKGGEGRATPDRDDEYMFYQMLVGSSPFELLESPSAEGLEIYRTRIHAALEKAWREGKRRSSWAAPDVEYETAMQAFAEKALRPEGGFLAAFLPFVGRVARLGVQNSLVQTALKLMAPGVPDFYQGCELRDLSLVDPDNRRSVDYRERGAALGKVGPRLEAEKEPAGLFESLLATWQDGRIKPAVTALLLALRRERAELFAEGGYAPIETTGEEADWCVRFVRAAGESRLAVLAARFPALREEKPHWKAQAQLPNGDWFDLLRAKPFDRGAPLSAWLGTLPLAVLAPAGSPT